MAHVLVIDDEPGILDVVGAMLASVGHTVAVADHGGAGIRMLDDHIDLIISDLIMPERDGLEVIMEARRLLPHVPIIAVSGGGRMRAADYLQTARLLGAARTLTKPFTRETLLAMVDELLEAA